MSFRCAEPHLDKTLSRLDQPRRLGIKTFYAFSPCPVWVKYLSRVTMKRPPHAGHSWVNLLVHPQVRTGSLCKEPGCSLKPHCPKKRRKEEKKTARGNYLPSFI